MIFVFDVDGTITVVGDRLNEIKKDEPDWDAFYDRCNEDEPNQAVINLLRVLNVNEERILLLTGRRESCRSMTEKWLLEHGIDPYSLELLMRSDGSHEKDTTLKPRMFSEWLNFHRLSNRDKSDFLFFEDRERMVNKWRELGYTCCHVDQGEF